MDKCGFLSPRYFNSIEIDRLHGVFKKKSANEEKLLAERNWYLSIPKELSRYVPKVFGFSGGGSSAELDLELFDMPALASLYIRSDSSDTHLWRKILAELFKIHSEFSKFGASKNAWCGAYAGGFENIYLRQTRERLNMVSESALSETFSAFRLKINGDFFDNFGLLADEFYSRLEKLSRNGRCAVIHGDFCFSNILFNAQNLSFKLVDPRGSFGGGMGIFGDVRYDMAKLRHSAVGLYDFITAGKYSLEEHSPCDFSFAINAPTCLSEISMFFDSLCESAGYQTEEITLIEAMLFLSMIPLHAEDARRQKAFYIIAIKKLNEIL
ncbi:MAG: hypothetical protein IJI37_00470 [Opitutales bacterium]|nr:hypothetical protein [Opitutales bacterium]